MKKKAIAIISVVLALAILTVFCINLFGCRDWSVRALWNLNHQSVSAQVIIEAVIEKNAGTESIREVLRKIVFPKEAYVDALQYEVNQTSYEFQVVLPKEKTDLFVDTLAHSGFTRWDTEFPPHQNFPQTFGPLSSEQISYIFDMTYHLHSPIPNVYIRGLGNIYIYIIESEEHTIVIIDV